MTEPLPKIEMDDEAMGLYVAPRHSEAERALIVAAIRNDPAKVALFNKMATWERDHKLYKEGKATKPDYAIMCGDPDDNQRRKRK